MDDICTLLKLISKPDFAIIGPEAPLAAGLSDFLEDKHIPCVIGPKKIFARIESSKSFCRNFLQENNLDHYSPKFVIIKNNKLFESNIEIIRDFKEIVIKRDGLCGGKGVFVQGEHFNTLKEGLVIIKKYIDNNEQVVVEEKLLGEEFSLMTLTDGYNNCTSFPPIQDYKRAYENDTGPNTGGMGCIIGENNCLPFLTQDDIDEATELNKSMVALLNRNLCSYQSMNKSHGYRGILYGSFMKCTDGSLKLIEYNSRFGDPEIILALALMKNNFIDVCKEILAGRLKNELVFSEDAAICRYLVPEGYPTSSQPKFDIYIDKSLDQNNIIYANVNVIGKHLYTDTSRSIAYFETGKDLRDCYAKINANIKKITGNLFYRKDIGAKYLSKYEIAGVSINAGNESVGLIKQYVEATYNEFVEGKHGDFGGQFRLGNSGISLVASTDGTGTKSIFVKKYMEDEGFVNLGQDIVNHCVNDILVQGAYPLFFLDYFASSKLRVNELVNFIKGISIACNENDQMCLLGGETAEMPDVYLNDRVDLVGTIVGLRDPKYTTEIDDGNVLIAFRSSGPHTNGYSLIRKVTNEHEPPTEILKTLLQPHRSYLTIVKDFVNEYDHNAIKGMCHITGGGFADNLGRILPDNMDVYLEEWELPSWCKWLMNKGNIDEKELKKVFNCGVGFIIITTQDIYEKMRNKYEYDTDFFRLGTVTKIDKMTLSSFTSENLGSPNHS
jgi:phosphoribosylamine--glycine ligase / phosphoribosylformylglycinamidine cyclo-ligase